MKPARDASGRFSAAPSISRHSREIAISFGPKQDTGIHQARNGGSIRRHWSESLPRDRPPATRAIRGKKSSLPGWRSVPVHQSRSCLRNASPSRRHNGRRATRTAWPLLASLGLGALSRTRARASRMALEEGYPLKPFRVVLRLVPGLFYVKCLERKNVPRVLRLFARTRIRGRNTRHFSYTRVLTWNTQNTWNKECFQ